MGSNQYRTRSGADADELAGSASQACGQVWGTSCTHPVHPPTYSHGRHGIMGVGPDREAAARCIGAPAAALAYLARDHSAEIRKLVAANPSCPPQVLEQLFDDPHEPVSCSVCFNPSLPPQLAVRLAKRIERLTHIHALTTNSSAPPAALQSVYANNQHADDSVWYGLAYRSDCPPDVLADMARRGPGLRIEAARHPRCPSSALVLLSQDEERAVRQAAMVNPSFPEEYRQLRRIAQ